MYRDTFLLLGFLRFLGFRANRQFYDIRNYRLSCPSVKIIFYRVDTLETHSPIQYHASHLGHGLLNIFKGMLITLQLPV